MAKRNSQGQGLKVLLIEDHDVVAEMMLMVLSQLGYNAERAATVAEADRKIHQTPFDVMLCDYSLPDGTALDLAKRIETHRPRPAGILLTAYGSESLPRTSDVFSKYLEKPVEPGDLDIAIREAHQAALT
jgi:two-component system response regulator PilR (NtrC family)